MSDNIPRIDRILEHLFKARFFGVSIHCLSDTIQSDLVYKLIFLYCIAQSAAGPAPGMVRAGQQPVSVPHPSTHATASHSINPASKSFIKSLISSRQFLKNVQF